MINVNVQKAKTIAHGKRRFDRAVEFAPWDEQISKQLPGADLQAAEAQRQSIREKYATMQAQIDASTTPTEIKTALGLS
jgi:hypothetical protein